MRVPNDLLKAVVYLGAITDLRVENGKERADLEMAGTAFWVRVPSPLGGSFVYLVTAAHVARDLQELPWGMRAVTESKETKVYSLEGVKWHYHDDPSVDVAIASFNPPHEIDLRPILVPEIDESFSNSGIDEMRRGFQANLGLGDEVAIIGLLPYIPGRQLNTPVARFGNISLMPVEPIPWKENGTVRMIECYVIEARSIGGLSGSPVFVNVARPNERPTFFQMGSVRGHWDKQNVNTGIAAVEPYYKMCEIIYKPELVEERRKVDKEYEKYANNSADAVSDNALKIDPPPSIRKGDDLLKTMLNTPPDEKTGSR